MKLNILSILLALLCAATPLAKTTYAQETSDITNIKSPGGYTITAFDRNFNRSIGGYFDTELKYDKNSLDFKAHRLILQASSFIHDNIFFNTEIEFEYGGKINSGTNDGELKIEQAWVDFIISEAANFRTGIVLIPIGRINILHDSDVRDTTNRPIYAKYIVPSTWFDVGAGMHGIFEAADWEFNYDVVAVNGLSKNTGFSTTISGTNGIRSARSSVKSDNNRDKAIAGRFGFSPRLGLDFGTSFYTGEYDDAGNDRLNLFGLDAFWQTGAFELLTEWATISINDSTATLPGAMWGYYIESRYHFMPKTMRNWFFAKPFDHPTFTAFLRYGEVDLDTAVKDVNDQSQLTFGFNYRPVDTMVFKFEYEVNNEKANPISNNAFYASVAVGF